MHEIRIMSAAQAILEAQDQALQADHSVYLMGEGVTDPKGIFGTTSGLVEKYGAARIIEMPIAENGLTGVAIGSALMGQRPIMVHQRVDFALLAMEQLSNNAAKMHFVSQGHHRVPLVVRMIIGRGWGQGPSHSQSLETLFAHVPGLKVVMPSSPADAKGLLLGAIADDNPVMFIEHRWMHYALGEVPVAATPMALDGPAHIRRGDAVTVVSSSYMTLEAIQAADALKDEGVQVDLFDLRVIKPLRLEAIAASLQRTGRLLVIDTGYQEFGIGAEIISGLMETCFSALKGSPRRLGLPSHPTPSSRALTEAYYVKSADITDTICDMIGLEHDKAERISARLKSLRDDTPHDIPHPSFKGPF